MVCEGGAELLFELLKLILLVGSEEGTNTKVGQNKRNGTDRTENNKKDLKRET